MKKLKMLPFLLWKIFFKFCLARYRLKNIVSLFAYVTDINDKMPLDKNNDNEEFS